MLGALLAYLAGIVGVVGYLLNSVGLFWVIDVVYCVLIIAFRLFCECLLLLYGCLCCFFCCDVWHLRFG